MPEPEQLLDADFDAQLRGLFAQAEKSLGATGEEAAPGAAAKPEEPGAAPASAPSGSAQKSAALTLPQLIRPLVLGLEAVSRATSENSALLKRMAEAGDRASGDEAGSGVSQRELPRLVADLKLLLEAKNAVSQSMFAALHEELRGYKDGFLLETVHKPIIRDLISLYDDIGEVHRQLTVALGEAGGAGASGAAAALRKRLETIAMNLEHNVLFIVEVLDRLEVTLMPLHTGKLHKRWQRAVDAEEAQCAEEHGAVVRCVKRGFFWKGRVIRPEEVVVKRWSRADSSSGLPIESLEEETAP